MLAIDAAIGPLVDKKCRLVRLFDSAPRDAEGSEESILNKATAAFLGIVAGVFLAFLVYIYKLPSCVEMAGAGFDRFECHKLFLSFGALFGVVMLLLISAGLYIFNPPPANSENAAKNVFDTFAKVLLPIATLILGYYFGTGNMKASSTDPRPKEPPKEQQQPLPEIKTPSPPPAK